MAKKAGKIMRPARMAIRESMLTIWTADLVRWVSRLK
jgi:hypothetical protein